MIEDFMGYMSKFDVEDDTAYAEITSSSGEKFEADFILSEVVALGIRERRRFIYRETTDDDGKLKIDLIDVPDRPLSPAIRAEIETMVSALGDDDALQNDY